MVPAAADPLERGGYGAVGLCVGDVLQGIPGDELVVTTLAGDIIVYDAASMAERWRTHVPGAAGMFSSIRIADLDNDSVNELYVAGSFGLWRFTQ